jgi:hypothetical protein
MNGYNRWGRQAAFNREVDNFSVSQSRKLITLSEEYLNSVKGNDIVETKVIVKESFM